MGDLISSSPEATVPVDGGSTVGIPKAVPGGKYPCTGPSSYWGIGAPVWRLSLILKSCFSISNSAIEFFFMRSMIALMSFRSTRVLQQESFHQETENIVLSRSLSKKAVTGWRALLSNIQIRCDHKEHPWKRQAVKRRLEDREKRLKFAKNRENKG